MRSKLSVWWRQPSGGRDVMAMALPLVVSMMSWTLMQFIDRMFLMWYTADALAASLPAGMMSFFVIAFPFGLANYAATFVAQYYGAGRPERMGQVVGQATWLALFTVVLVAASRPGAPWFFSWLGHEGSIQVLEVDYYLTMALGAVMIVTSAAWSSLLIGLGNTRTLMYVDMATAVVNIVLDYLLIFGNGGFPEMGIAGAGWGTSLAHTFKACLLLAILLGTEYRETYQIVPGMRFSRELMLRMLRFGFPNGLQFFFEIGTITMFVNMVGRLGTLALSATNMAFNVNSLVFIPLFGISTAVSSLVGQRLGDDKPDLAARATWSALSLSLCYGLFFSVAYAVVPDLFLFAHAAQADAVSFEEIRRPTIVLLRFVAAYCLFDTLYMVFAGAVKGAGDTKFVLWVTALSAPYPALGAWLAVSHFGWGLYGAWAVLTSWVWFLGIIYLHRFLQGKWRSMRVIEAAVPLKEEELSAESTNEKPSSEAGLLAAVEPASGG